MTAEITNYEHFRCPICFFILIEPVSLPCNHKLCLACFDKQVEEVNYTCPICRHRISNWARTVSRENNLIDEELWNKIQNEFPTTVSDHIRRKISLGLISAKCLCLTTPCSCTIGPKHCTDTPEKKAVSHIFAHPGEISREYQLELQKVREEYKLERQEEMKANEDFILANLTSESKRRRLKNFLQLQQTTPADQTTTVTSKLSDQGPVRSRSATGVSSNNGGDEKSTIYRSPSTSSIDSITPEVQGYLFKPIHCSPRTPPRKFGQSSVPKQPMMPPFVSYPPVIRSVPRVMDGCDTSSESSFASSCSSMSNFRGGPPQKFRRRYPTRAATRRAVVSMGASGVACGGLGREGSTGSSAHSGFVSPIVDSFSNLGATCNQSGMGGNKGGTLVASSDSLMDLVSESLHLHHQQHTLHTSPDHTCLSSAAALANRTVGGCVGLQGVQGATAMNNPSPSPTNTRSGRSSRLAAPSTGGPGGKRKQQPPDEKENSVAPRVEMPEYKKLRLNPALFQQSFEYAHLNKDESAAAAAALALSASSNKLDPSLFVNSRRSGVEFLSMEAYKQYVASRDAQIKLDQKLAKELSQNNDECEADDSNSGSSSPIEERTYSLRKRKVNYRQ